MKAKHDIDKFNFEHKIMDLQEKLKEKDDDQAEKTRSKDMAAKKNKTGTQEFANPADLLKLRLDKVVNNNKEKKTLKILLCCQQWFVCAVVSHSTK